MPSDSRSGQINAAALTLIKRPLYPDFPRKFAPLDPLVKNRQSARGALEFVDRRPMRHMTHSCVTFRPKTALESAHCDTVLAESYAESR
jgi:hypothetical protein